MPASYADSVLTSYPLLHRTKPIKLYETLDIAIKKFLWYMPGISSFQASTDALLQELKYNDPCFNYLMSKINISDVNIYWERGKIPNAKFDQYRSIFNNEDQTLILAGSAEPQKTVTLLTHLRNCIAHGQFNISGDTLFGFDKYGKNITAIIKLKTDSLFSLIHEIESDNLKIQIFAHALEKLGYHIAIDPPCAHYSPDLLASIRDQKYAIELKHLDAHGKYINSNAFQNCFLKLSQYEATDDTLHRVLFLDTGCLTKNSIELLKGTSIKVFDWDNLKQLFDGIDILSD